LERDLSSTIAATVFENSYEKSKARTKIRTAYEFYFFIAFPGPRTLWAIAGLIFAICQPA